MKTITFKKIGAAALLTAAVIALVLFGSAIRSYMTSIQSEPLSCRVSFAEPQVAFNYIQFDLREQDPTEPYFNGGFFINLGKTVGTNPVDMQLTFSGNKTFGSTNRSARLLFDKEADALWMSGESQIGLNRTEGSHRQFPFDSAAFDFDLTYAPAIPFYNFFLRNHNPNFSIPCRDFTVTNIGPGKAHIHFIALRNPFVRLTALVLVGAGAMFMVAILMFVKTESLPTAVASYFFSLWSIRSILSSEIKTFPTYLDFAILCLCVLLLIGLSIRLAFKELGIFRGEQEKIGFT
jgi:hypothetical protein